MIVMEYASRGDLYDYICDKRNISEREARHFFRQIVSAVHYCHQVGLCSSNPLIQTKSRCFTGYVISGKCQPSSCMAATSDPMARRFSQTRCSAPCSFSGHWHPLSYIMGIIHCQPVVLNRDAVRKIQDEPNALSVESEAKG